MTQLYKVIHRKKVTMFNRRMRQAKDAFVIDEIAVNLTFADAKKIRKLHQQYEIAPMRAKGQETDEPTN